MRQLLVRDSDHVVWSYGTSLGPLPGHTIYTVDAGTYAAYLTALPKAQGRGCTFSDPIQNADETWSGTITPLQ